MACFSIQRRRGRIIEFGNANKVIVAFLLMVEDLGRCEQGLLTRNASISGNVCFSEGSNEMLPDCH